MALLTGLLIVCGAAGSALGASAYAISPWPFSTLQLGIASPPGDAAAQQAQAPFGFRYQYLSGGVNTGDSWQTWGADFVSSYITESEAANMVPVFSYYEMRQSDPGAGVGDEAMADLENLQSRSTMLAYYTDLKAFFQEASVATGPVVIQIEPDLWGYLEQRNRNAAKIRAAVASTGMPDLHGLSNTAAGFAQAILRLRDDDGPRVIVAYHDSIWGSGKDIQQSHPTNAEIPGMAAASVAFYRSLHAHFNAIFTETADRDAGYAQNVNGEGTSHWWARIDFVHLGEYIADFHRKVRLPVVIWQIPVGNTFMRVLNNTDYHYQDNKVQSLLGAGKSAHTMLRFYARSGVAALLFGSGQGNDTCACDNDNNLLSNEPAPIDGNTEHSLSTDDDGGYFMSVAKRYYAGGALRFSR